MKIKDAHVTINVSDLEKSISFYKSIGFELKMQWGEHYAQLIAPGITIGLHPSSSTGSGGVSIGFTADDFEKAKTGLKELFIKATERNEEGGSFLHFNDPDGTPLYFIKPKW